VVPFKKETNGTTGHIDWHCRVEVVDEQGDVMTGPPTIYGVSLQVLKDTHGGLHENFLRDVVKPLMLQEHEARTMSHAEADSLVGKSL
jgi:hypothetical protein